MLHEDTLIATLALSLAFAFCFGLLAVRLRLPPLVGYLIAGIALGPYTPGWVADAHLAPQLAEIGVMLLMFGVGTHFSLRDLLAVRGIAIPGAVAQIAVATALGMGAAHFWGWPLGAGVIFGLALSVASTVVLLRALEAQGTLATEQGRIAVGWLLVEDLITVLALVLLPALAGVLGGEAPPGVAADPEHLWRTLGITLGKVALFVALMLLVGARVFPWILRGVVRTKSRELFTLAAVALSLGVAFGSAKLFDVSVALGRVLRRHGDQWLRSQSSRFELSAAAAGHVRGAVLRRGRHAVRAQGAGAPSARGARRARDHRARQVRGRVRDRAPARSSHRYGPHGGRRARPDR